MSYGLTASNSLLIAWSNACVERSATNRVDATIELFASGDIQATVFDHSTFNVQHSTFLPAQLPEGWTGEGQDSTWASMAFPSNATEIAEDGYESWLTDWVGINEQNGIYKASITVMSLPMSGPCYLVCGPYKVVVKEPGVYSFPLEVFEHYTARTYPEAVPLSVEYDDGYRGDADDATSSSAAPRRAASLLSFSPMLDVCMIPTVHLSPSTVELADAVGTQISIWCNMALDRIISHYSHSGHTRIVYRNSTVAELVSAAVSDLVVFTLRKQGHEVTAEMRVLAPNDPTHCPYCLLGG